MQIFSGIFPVCYGQFYFLSKTDWDGNLYSCFKSQSNGLCGAANKGVVFFVTGLHTGNITLNVELHEADPGMDLSNDEIVEISFSIAESDMWLESWDGEIKRNLGLPPGDYRARYSAKNFDLAEELGKFEEGNIEFYSVDIWPGGIEKNRIVKATAEKAKYWHSELGK